MPSTDHNEREVRILATADRVRQFLDEEGDGCPRLIEGADRVPNDAYPSDRERGFRDWGIVWGVAFGLLAANAKPDEIERVGSEARAAAMMAGARWGALDFEPRPDFGVIDTIILAHREDAESGGNDAVEELIHALGVPR